MKKKKYFIILFLIIITISVVTFARFIYTQRSEHYLESKDFYFYSDVLTLNNKKYTVSNWNGKEAYVFEFNLNNYKNDLAITKDDINYKVSVECPSNATCTTDLTGNIGTLTGNSKVDKTIKVTVVMNEEIEIGEEINLKLTVESTSPYKKVLKANFIIELSDYVYQIEDVSGRAYLILELINPKDEDITYHLSFDPRKINVDMTSPLVDHGTKGYTTIDGETYINSLDVTLDSTSTKELIFYKDDITQDYTYPVKNKQSIITVE